ncbi:MAG: DUF1697 domain-containing protein [Sandaracinaceae bacterium]|nr:DUF1697 domain-containing protein [Sandaracinaceae bacterium]
MPGATHIAFLRGINVGGKRSLPMKRLVAIFEAAGGEDVRTYIQSGNVVFRARRAAGLAERVTEDIEEQFGFQVPVVLRTAGELGAVPGACPFPASEPKALHVAFLAERPPDSKIALLDPSRSPGDRFAVIGKDIHLCLPNGVGKSKLTNEYFDRALGTTSTLRNWRTVLELIRLCE